MIKRILVLLFLSASLCQGAITRVGGTAYTANTGAANATTLNITFTTTPTVGNIVVIGVAGHLSSTPVYRMTDVTGITWTQIQRTTSGPVTVFLIGRVTATPGTNVFTINSTSASTMAAIGAEYSGTNLRIDQITSNSAGSGTSMSTGTTGTTSAQSEVWLAMFAAKGQNNNDMGSTGTNSFTRVGTQQNTTNNSANLDVTGALYERILTGGSTASTTVTLTTTNAWTGVILTLEETPTTTTGGSTSIPSIGR